jgi:hypothetical protein
VEVNIAAQGTSVPFEIKGGSPIVLHVVIEGSTYELRLTPVVAEVRHLVGIPNALDPTLPTFALQLTVPVGTKKL